MSTTDGALKLAAKDVVSCWKDPKDYGDEGLLRLQMAIDQLDAAIKQARSAPVQEMTVVDPADWVPCTPEWINQGGDCAKSPRVWSAKECNHYHPASPNAAQPAPDARHMPGWMKYDAATDVLIIHGRRYSAAMFGESGFLAQVGTLLRIEDGQPECITLTTVQPAVPLTDWVSVDDRLPESGGYYLVTVDTDEGPHVDVLLYSVKEKHWLHEGEPTFCHSYFFSPTHWAVRPEAARGIKKGGAA